MIGAPVMWPADDIPEGALVLDGSTLDVSLYPNLYAAYGRCYTPSDIGPSFFMLPDYRGRALRGVDMGSGNDPEAADSFIDGFQDKVGRSDRGDGVKGDAVGTIQDDAWKSHNHLANGGGGSANSTAISIAESTVLSAIGSIEQPKTSGNTGAAAETRCDNIALTFITFYQ